VLHDMRLHDLIYMLHFHARGDREGYLDVLHRWYGTEGRRAGEAFCAGGLSSESMIERFPLTRAALEGALGVVVHSDALGSTGEAPGCPVRMVPHPYAAMDEREYGAIAEARRARLQPPFRLLLFGYLGRNRRIESVLRGLAESGRKEEFRLEICGALWDEARVRGLIADLGLSGVVSLRGYLSDAELAQALKAADLAFNLRYPSMGEASGSQCRLWDYGVPALVTRTQWYAGLPDDAVAFVRVEQEIEDIAAHLAKFAEDPAAYYAKGEDGRRLLARFDPGAYARALVDFADEARGYAPRLAALRVAERVGDDAGRWLAPCAAEGLFERVERELALGE
jgi:glycosyltransferase involved in cell wall biosynthesis